MKMKPKAIIVISVTMIIGFVLGMLTSAQIRYHRIAPVSVFFSEERFKDGFYKTIQPDDKQKGKIDIILNKYARINSELQNNFRRELEINVKNFRNEIDSNLTSDQIGRLKVMDEQRMKMIRQHRKNFERDSSKFPPPLPRESDSTGLHYHK
jgi:hypothetical protein